MNVPKAQKDCSPYTLSSHNLQHLSRALLVQAWSGVTFHYIVRLDIER